MNLLSIDVGFGSTKVSYVDSSSTLQHRKYVTALAKKVNSGIYTDEDSVELNGASYLCFDRALHVPAAQQIQVVDYDSLELATPIFIKYLIQSLGIQFDSIVVGLSIAMLDKSKRYHQHISTALGIDPARVVVLQQGVGGWACYQAYGLDPEAFSQSTILMKNYLLVDIGHNTMDVLSVLGGKLSEDTIDGITGAGTTWMANALIKYLMAEYKIDVTPVNAREYLERKSFKDRGMTIDLTPVLARIGYEYVQFIINTLESKFAGSMQNRDGLLFIGGTCHVIGDIISKNPEAARLFSDKYGNHFINIPKMPEYYNVAGYYLLGTKILASRGIV